MKRVILIIFLLLMFSQFAIAEVTGETISNLTGKATSQQVGLSIFIQMPGGVPSIEFISPKNNTYLRNESILLDYNIVAGDFVWYNLDNTPNITLSSFVYLNVSQGQHTIYLYSNNSNGTAVKQLTFTANSSRFIILYESYKGVNKGSSTNFLNYTYEEIQELNNIILEDTRYGKIKFNSVINLTNDSINNDNLLDLDSNTELAFNYAGINSSVIPNFNVPSTIWLYNLSFTNPRILRDGVVCPPSICVRESYFGGILKFNVTEFSSYSAQETPVIPPEEGDSGGGGGGGGGIGIEETNESKEEGEENESVEGEQLYLFDANIRVLNDNSLVNSGSKLKTSITLIPIEHKKRMNVTINYYLKDYDGRTYLEKSERILIDKQITFKRNFDTGVLPLGKYIIEIELIYPDGVSPASAQFEIIPAKENTFFGKVVIFLINLIIIILVIILLIEGLKILKRVRKKREKEAKKEQKNKKK